MYIQYAIQIIYMVYMEIYMYSSSHLEVFLGKSVLKIHSKFTEPHPCRSAISINLYNINISTVAISYTSVQDFKIRPVSTSL